MNRSSEPCPLCDCADTTLFSTDNRRHYQRCTYCQLVFVPRAYYLSISQERAEYDLHENVSDDPDYRQFLDRTLKPLIERLQAGAVGLDFGCGPGPTLSLMLQEVGFSTDIYDLFYAPDLSVFSKSYDFVTATEVIEHLHQPLGEIERLMGLLNDRGILAIMTKRVTDQQAFSRWHYKNDPTHVCFYSEVTFEWLADYLGASLEQLDKDVIFLTKSS